MTIISNDANGNVPVYSLAITLMNNQSTATSANFPCLITINSNSYSSYLASDLKNVCFQDGAGVILKSYLESGETNTSTATKYWVLIPNSIAGSGGTLIIYMVMVSTSASSMNILFTGAEPSWSGGTYGQYDTGSLIFTTFYDNFAGLTLNASKWQVLRNDGYYIHSDGIDIVGGNVSTWESIGSQTNTFNQQTHVLEAYLYFDGLNGLSTTYRTMGFNPPGSSLPQIMLSDYESTTKYTLEHCDSVFNTVSTTITGGSISSYQWWSLWSDGVKAYLSLNYGIPVNVTLTETNTSASIGIAVCNPIQHLFCKIIRLRPRAPSDVMPTVSFSSICYVEDDYTPGVYFPIYLISNGDGTYTADLNPFMFLNQDMYTPFAAKNTYLKVTSSEVSTYLTVDTITETDVKISED